MSETGEDLRFECQLCNQLFEPDADAMVRGGEHCLCVACRLRLVDVLEDEEQEEAR